MACKGKYTESMEALEKLYKGRVRAIGVSNSTIHHFTDYFEIC